MALTEEQTSKFADVKGVRTHYNEAGSPDAPVVVMLHGGGPGATGWSNFQRNIDAFSQHYRVLLVDQLGFGKTDYRPLEEPLFTMNARLVRDLLDVLGIETAHLIGNSNGGGVSMAFAADYPDRADRLVLMGASVGGPSLFVPMPAEGLKGLARARRNPTLETMREAIEIMTYDHSFMTDELLQQRLDAALATHRPETLDIPVPQRIMASELHKITHKSLIIWGRDDRTVPFDWGLRALWGLPDAELHVFSHCGHWAQFEKAPEFNDLVLKFLAPGNN